MNDLYYSGSDEYEWGNPFPGTDASMFIQWKGTDACFDFACRCGVLGHFDGYFASNVQCPTCGTIYEMGTQVLARVLEAPTHRPVVLDVRDDSGDPESVDRWK